jgi:hypothetical protein
MERKIIPLIILTILIFSCNKNDINTLNNGLVAYYPLDGNAIDASGNNHDGVTYGTVLTEDRFNHSGKALLFSGTNSYINLHCNFDYQLRTINLWFYANTIDQIARHIYISDNPKLKYGFSQIKIMEINGTKQIRSSAGIGGGTAEGNAEVLGKKWYMITLVVDTNETRHYLDGSLIGKFANGYMTSNAGDTSALLGVSREYDRYFEGKLDDVRIYNRALSEAEIKKLY